MEHGHSITSGQNYHWHQQDNYLYAKALNKMRKRELYNYKKMTGRENVPEIYTTPVFMKDLRNSLIHIATNGYKEPTQTLARQALSIAGNIEKKLKQDELTEIEAIDTIIEDKTMNHIMRKADLPLYLMAKQAHNYLEGN